MITDPKNYSQNTRTALTGKHPQKLSEKRFTSTVELYFAARKGVETSQEVEKCPRKLENNETRHLSPTATKTLLKRNPNHLAQDRKRKRR